MSEFDIHTWAFTMAAHTPLTIYEAEEVICMLNTYDQRNLDKIISGAVEFKPEYTYAQRLKSEIAYGSL